MLIQVKVTPKAKVNQVLCPTASLFDKQKSANEIFKIKTTAAPEKGQANAAVIELLAKEFKVAKSQVEIVQGLTQRNKLVRINV